MGFGGEAIFFPHGHCSDVAGLLLIDPLFEGLFLDKKQGESADSATQSNDNNQLPMTWSEFWTKQLTTRWSGVWISAVVGFNRFSLMLGLMSPVEDPKLNDMLPKEVILRKVNELICYLLCSLSVIINSCLSYSLPEILDVSA